MAKIRKVQSKQNEHLRKKQNQNDITFKKKNKSNRKVLLESIDNISNSPKSSTTHKVFNVDVAIRAGTLSVNKKSLKLQDAKNINISLSFDSKEAIVYHYSIDRPGKVNQPKTLNELIESTWRKCKADNNNDELSEGQVVLAKMKGYTPWPGVIEKFTVNKKRAKIRFFGTHNVGSVETKESVRMEMSNDVIRLLLLRSLDSFCRGIREAEEMLGIDEKHSVTREQRALK